MRVLLDLECAKAANHVRLHVHSRVLPVAVRRYLTTRFMRSSNDASPAWTPLLEMKVGVPCTPISAASARAASTSESTGCVLKHSEIAIESTPGGIGNVSRRDQSESSKVRIVRKLERRDSD